MVSFGRYSTANIPTEMFEDIRRRAARAHMTPGRYIKILLERAIRLEDEELGAVVPKDGMR